MRGWAAFSLLLLLGLTTVIPGCSRDPNARKQKYLESGQRYFNKGKYREAAIQLGNAIQVDSRYADAHYQLAKTELKLQQWSLAYQELNRVLELEPEPANYQVHLDLANLLIAGRDFKQAQEHLTFLLEREPRNSQVHLALANLQAAQENFPGAIEEARTAVSLAPDQWEPYVALGQMQMKVNQFDQAEINLKKAVEVSPKVAETQLALGDYYQSRSRYAEAEQQYWQAINSDPSNPDRCTALVRLYMVQGKKDQAENFLKQVTQKFPGDSVGYRMLGDFYFAAGDLDKAVTEYAALYRDHPKDIQVKKNYIQLLILKNQLDDGQKLNNEILAATPNDVDAIIDQAQIQIRSGHPDKAIATLRTAINSEPANSAAHYYLGVALEANGDLAQAQTELQESVRLRPDLPDAYRELAGVAMREGDPRGLEDAATHMIALQPGSPDGYLYRALSNLNQRRFILAEKDIQKATDLAPQSPAAYVQMGNLKSAQRQFAEAGDSYQQALERDPTSPDALSGLMNVYLAQNQPDKAVSVARAQIAKVGNSSAFYDLLGTVLFNNKRDLSGAEAALEKATTLDKNNADAFLKLGELLVAKGSTDEAIATYQSSLQGHPEEPSFYILLGELYESQRAWDKAAQMYQKVLEIRPGNPVASNNLAYIMLQTGGNPDVALALAQTARRGMVDSPNAADTLGWVYYQKGAFKAAIDLFQEALRLQQKGRTPDNPTIHYHLALAYEKVRQPALAKEQFQRVLKISPNYSDAAAVEKELAQLMVAPPAQ